MTTDAGMAAVHAALADAAAWARINATAPSRIQLKRTKGWRMPEGTAKVDRSTRWGNPFEVGHRVISPGAYGSLASPYHGCLPSGQYEYGNRRGYEIFRIRDRADAVTLFASYVKADPSGWPADEIRRSLGGLSLACWCPIPAEGEPDICHATVLLEIANG